MSAIRRSRIETASSLPFFVEETTEGFDRRFECETRRDPEDRNENDGDSHEHGEEGRQVDREDLLVDVEGGEWHARYPAGGVLVGFAKWM